MPLHLTRPLKSTPANENECPDPSTPAWIYEPAGVWTPNQIQLSTAQAYADYYYAAGNNCDYSIGQLIQDIDDHHDTIMGMLNNAQINEIFLAGEARNWKLLSPYEFAMWQRWFYLKLGR